MSMYLTVLDFNIELFFGLLVEYNWKMYWLFLAVVYNAYHDATFVFLIVGLHVVCF